MTDVPWHPATQVVAAGRPPRVHQAATNPPVVLTSTYLGTGEPAPGEKVYTRWGTETWEPLEEALATIEECVLPAVSFSSGMAAIDATLDLVLPGGHLILPDHAYHATALAAGELARRSGITFTQVPIAETDAVIAAIAQAAQQVAATAGDEGPDSVRRPILLWIESPTNPSLEIADIPALTRAAHEAGALVVVDNTFATPLGQQPLAHGVDAVVHSVTKAIAGHSDVLLGAVLSNDRAVADLVRARRTLGGAIPGPWESWLALRGLRTLSLRLERASANAGELARRLEVHPLVREVGYPGLPSHPQHERAGQLLHGYGSIMTLRPVGGLAGAQALVESVRLWLPATSLGGVESSLERRRRFATEAPDIPEDLLRLSVGIEDVEDLAADLFQALEAAGRATSS